jgi:hypothetical protein
MDKLDIVINKLEDLEKKVQALDILTSHMHDMVRTIYRDNNVEDDGHKD